MYVRGKLVTLEKHAFVGMRAERPPWQNKDVTYALEEPDNDDGKTATKRIGARTIIVRYDEDEHEILVRSVSGTRRNVAP